MTGPPSAYLDGLGRFGALGLDRMRRLCALLDHPEEAFRAYHVAGTNGKGSVCAFLASVLWAAGRPAGLYTSPPLQVPEERLVVDGQRIQPAELAHLVEAVRGAAERMPEPPTAFEAWTAAAFLQWARRRVPWAVVEVGLGGREDATAVLARPLVTVIASIHRDHVAQLGPTLDRIAFEKAGILRPGVPAVVGALPAPARRVVERRAEEVGAPLLRLGQEIRLRPLAGPATRPRFDLEVTWAGGRRLGHGLESGLAGAHQAANAALAVAALWVGEAQGGPAIPEAALRRGLTQAVWPGRLERVGPWLLDGAHNLDAARHLARYLREEGRPYGWVVAGMRDRPPSALLDPLLPGARWLVATAVASPRARPAQAWRQAARRRGREALAVTPVAEALRRAEAERRGDEEILVAGSLALVGAAREALGLPPPFGPQKGAGPLDGAGWREGDPP